MNLYDEFAGSLLPQSDACPQGLSSWNGSDPQQRFAVYRNNVVVSLIGALADNYPVTLRMVGEDFFSGMAQLYMAAEPPRSAVMVQYGDAFPDFIEGFPPAAGLPYLADLARLELYCRQSFHAADAATVTPAALQGLLADEAALARVRFTLHPALRAASFRHAAVSLWTAHQQEDTTSRLATVDPLLAEHALLLRPEMVVQVLPIEEGAAAFITNLQQGLTFAEAVNTRLPFNLGGALELLIRYGAITRVDS
jgi:hypothetical protein